MTTSTRVEPSTAMQDEDEIKNEYIAKLRDRVVEKLVRENQWPSFSADRGIDQLTRIVEQRILGMVPDFHTPDHPTYAFMIRRAIMEQKDGGRTDREAISEFIRTEYEDLPLAHETVLTFQLNNLCDKGEILLSARGCYLLPVGDYIQHKMVMKENGEQWVKKKSDGGGEAVVNVSNVKGNEVDGELREVEVCSRQMKGKKRKDRVGLRLRGRWSKRRQSSNPLEDETNKGGGGIVVDLTQTQGQNDATRDDQNCHTELLTEDHGLQDQPFGISKETLEPPGFPSKSNQLITQKHQAQADLQAFQIGAEVDQKQKENKDMKSDISQCFDGGKINEFGEHDLFKPACNEPLQPMTGANIISEDAQEIQLQTPAPAVANDLLTPYNVDRDLPELEKTEIEDGVLLPSEQGKPEAGPISQSTVMEINPLKVKETAGQFQEPRLCTDDVSDHSVLNPIPPMAQGDQLTLSTEVVNRLVNPIPDACSTALGALIPDDNQQPEKQEMPMHRGRGRPRKTTPTGFSLITEKPRKKDGRGRPRKVKLDELPEYTADVELEKASKKAAGPWDWEMAGARTLEHNLNLGNDHILTTESASHDKEGTNKCKRIERPPKINKDEPPENMDSPKAKKGRGKGRQTVCYTDISITDLIYSQDPHLRPMSRFRGRPRKL